MSNKKHRVLIVGTGSIGERHLRCFQQTGRADLAICETNASLRETVGQRYGVKRAFSDLEAALQEPYDAAVIATPAQLHVSMAMTLARAGVHLLIEKPLSTSLADVDALSRIIAERHLATAIGYTWRANPTVAQVREVIAGGRFGRPLQFNIITGQRLAFYRPAYAKTYYRDRATGGGAIQDAMTHMLNMGEWLVGPIDRLVADCAHLALEDVDVEDTVHVLTRQGGVLGSYSLNQHQAPNETSITVVCENATVRGLPALTRWQWMAETSGEWNIQQLEPIERDTMYIDQANAFLDAVEGKRAPLCSLAQGVQTLKVNLAVLASCDTGSWQQVRPC
jgi:predicted dehydrogenase